MNDFQGVTVGAAGTEVSLCAERAESGGGRLYAVTYITTDGSGNAVPGQAVVVVPHHAEGNR